MNADSPVDPLQPSMPMGTKTMLLPFTLPGAGTTRRYKPGQVNEFEARVDLPFLPLGLLIWDPTEDTYVTRLYASNFIEGTAAFETRMPGKWFAAASTFEDLRRAERDGELEKAPYLGRVLEMHELQPNTTLRVGLMGPFESFIVWGRTYVDGHATRTGEVVLEERGGRSSLSEQYGDAVYCARLQVHTLAGSRTLMTGKAATPELAVKLLELSAGVAHSRY